MNDARNEAIIERAAMGWHGDRYRRRSRLIAERCAWRAFCWRAAPRRVC